MARAISSMARQEALGARGQGPGAWAGLEGARWPVACVGWCWNNGLWPDLLPTSVLSTSCLYGTGEERKDKNVLKK